MAAEGSLQAPQRHPIGWREADFYDENSALKEMHRIFDICHGCRRCFNLCNAFPLLFDAIDDNAGGELEGLPRKVYWEVTDQCYLCDMCFMTKCPYVPPHPFNLDFPHVMLRAKAVKFKQGKVGFRDKLLSSTDAVGKLASIPVVVKLVNAVNRTPATRNLMQRTLGVHKDRILPDYASPTFLGKAEPRADFAVRDGKSAPGKVAIFSTCYVNYNEPEIGYDLVKLLEHNEIPSRLVRDEVCCGMPKLELGDLEGVERLKNKNIPELARLAREGYALLTPVPSCTLMFKQELPLLFPDDQDVKAVAQSMFDPFEYFMLRRSDGLLRTDFKTGLGKVSYHVPCHTRVQNMGQKTRELLQIIPATEVRTVQRCSGHDGTWGVKTEYFATSMKIGAPVFKQMAEGPPDYVSSDCPIAARHILQGMGGKGVKEHPLTLLRIAYGL